jgi:hypothetical protein
MDRNLADFCARAAMFAYSSIVEFGVCKSSDFKADGGMRPMCALQSLI